MFVKVCAFPQLDWKLCAGEDHLFKSFLFAVLTPASSPVLGAEELLYHHFRMRKLLAITQPDENGLLS